jgi:hypothetical protein
VGGSNAVAGSSSFRVKDLRSGEGFSGSDPDGFRGEVCRAEVVRARGGCAVGVGWGSIESTSLISFSTVGVSTRTRFVEGVAWVSSVSFFDRFYLISAD